MEYTTFEYATLGIWVVVIMTLVYGIVIIHDIPASIAKKRNHPHHDAIEATGWVSLFFLHALWPFLWIWAMTYNPKDEKEKIAEMDSLKEEMQLLKDRLLVLETKKSCDDDKEEKQ